MLAFKQLGNGDVERRLQEASAYVIVVVDPEPDTGLFKLSVIANDVSTPTIAILNKALETIEGIHTKSAKNN